MNDLLSYYPNVTLLIGLLTLFILDFGFGVWKATVLGIRRTSEGFRKTFNKFLQYGGSIIVGMVLLNIVGDKDAHFASQYSWLFGDLLLYIMIYIEVVSIFENMEAIGGSSDFVKYFIRPVRRMITFQLKNLLKDEEPHITADK
ncbi:phage holin family protein [Elizabethkingia anophelis]|uniref:phage holin family protein n=1 Tax=Elizabethkingia anophelis TaxID=1117645 RepID=UPI0021A34078|nr:phage holin family protein [Elizabethkingia anophelis]MCT3672004.1 phage holin family protein [Elizabethkingia anophelis]MCT3679024.1 phage holin family protein [Elizabethkingia anophelis]MCT4079304.1 phage holin family protein [Elizabethkingia anophelis]MCT4121454.1 phage holin family protein [Elizabethkingia anophelis]MCT4236773.1 phage holin family protein [Elizabethkingia anophelis]